MNLRQHTLMIRIVAMVVLLAVLSFSLACYGQFPLTKAVYHFNGDVTDNELGQSLLFWVFIILPVYWFASLGDAIIFNLIEFWTGDTLDIASANDVSPNTTVALLDDGATLRVTNGDAGVLTTEIAPGTFEVADLDGNVTGIVHRTDAGGLELCDANGNVLQSFTADQLAALAM